MPLKELLEADPSRRRLLQSAPVRLAPLLLGPLAWWGLSRRPDPDRGKLRVIAVDVGQGDCTLVVTPSGRTILVDGGGTSDEMAAGDTDVGARIVVPLLQYLGINFLDVLVLTHPHGDHVGGLAAVVHGPRIGAILDGTVLPYPSPAYLAFRQGAAQRNIAVARAVRGQTLNMGDGVMVTVLNPPDALTYGASAAYGTGSDDATINNYSVGLRIDYGQTRFILTGDAENEAEGVMLAAHPGLACDVLKAGHHGSKNATGEDWVSRLAPRFAVISCGRHNRFGHPAPSTLARLDAHGVNTYRTDTQGAITFVSDGKTVTARPFLR